MFLIPEVGSSSGRPNRGRGYLARAGTREEMLLLLEKGRKQGLMSQVWSMGGTVR